MYRLYYHYKTNGDTLFLVIEPESYPDRVEEKGDVVALYKENRLVGVNFLHIGKTMKIHAEGMIVTPENVVVDVLNSLLVGVGMEKIPYCEDSYYVVGKVTKKEEHPLNEKLSILTVDVGDGVLSTVTRYANIEEGSHIVLAKDGCLRFDGSQFHARVEKNINIDAEVCSESDLRLGKEDKEAILVPELSVGMDFFLR